MNLKGIGKNYRRIGPIQRELNEVGDLDRVKEGSNIPEYSYHFIPKGKANLSTKGSGHSCTKTATLTNSLVPEAMKVGIPF